LAIGLGSFIGGVSRHLLTQFVQGRIVSVFPFGTFAVNIIGCFLIGIVFGLGEKSQLSDDWKLFLTTGLLGGFTTFSAFSNETIQLLRDSEYLHAAVYSASSVGTGLLATMLGIFIIKLF
jgi:CrcB protein